MDYLGQIGVNSINIIESIEEGDYKSGKRLYEDISHLKFKFPNLEITFTEIYDFDELESEIKKIRKSAEFGSVPLIHFEAAHANKEIFTVECGQEIPWSKFLKLLLPINEILNMRLLLSIGACYSSYVLAGMKELINEHSPCVAVLGTQSEITGIELTRQYTIIYKNLFDLNSLSEALNVLEKEYLNPLERVNFISAHKLFRQGLRKYINDRDSDFKDVIDRRVKLVEENQETVLSVYRNKEENDLRELIMLASHLHKDFFIEQCVKNFFMCDLYPQNYSRFSIKEFLKDLNQ